MSSRIKDSTLATLREVVYSDPYHRQFLPLIDEIDWLRTSLSECEHHRDFVVAACRGVTMDSAGLRVLESLRDRLKRYESVVSAAVALDNAATVDHMSVEEVQRCYVNLHVAVNAYRAGIVTKEQKDS
jgi:hypothetical protein